MIFIRVLLFSLLTIVPAHALIGGDEVRNGGGIAEAHIRFAANKLPFALSLCLSKESCYGTSENKTVLHSLNEYIKDSKTVLDIQFLKGKERPDIFVIDGVPRLAVTYNRLNAPIYYNLDFLYSGNEVRFTFLQAIQSLVHELAHHLGHTDHDQLEVLGSRVRTIMEALAHESEFLPHLGRQGFKAMGIEKKSFTEEGSLHLIFQDQSVELSSLFKDLKKSCPTKGSTEDLKSSTIQFYNLSMQPAPITSLLTKVALKGTAVLYCQFQYLKKTRHFYDFEINIELGFSSYLFYRSSALSKKPKLVLELNSNTF